jgi:hypothetical protein
VTPLRQILGGGAAERRPICGLVRCMSGMSRAILYRKIREYGIVVPAK